jgi:hypothetical protein
VTLSLPLVTLTLVLSVPLLFGAGLIVFDTMTRGSRRICCRSRFATAEPETFQYRAAESTLDAGAIDEISKNEDTSCDALEHLKCRIRYSLEKILWTVNGWLVARLLHHVQPLE